jgi:hypothetical protein
MTSLVCNYENSGYRFYTVSKLLELRKGLPKPLPKEYVQFAREISAALMDKQTGGAYDGVS